MKDNKVSKHIAVVVAAQFTINPQCSASRNRLSLIYWGGSNKVADLQCTTSFMRNDAFCARVGSRLMAGRKSSRDEDIKIKKGKRSVSHRYNRIPLLHSCPGGVDRELVVRDLPFGCKSSLFRDIAQVFPGFLA